MITDIKIYQDITTSFDFKGGWFHCSSTSFEFKAEDFEYNQEFQKFYTAQGLVDFIVCRAKRESGIDISNSIQIAILKAIEMQGIVFV